MHRFYIPPHSWKPDHLALDSAESHHATDVLRLDVGDRVTVFNGEGAEITAEIAKVGKGSVELKKLHEGKSPRLACQITLGQAIPKGKNMDFIVEKATELGVFAISPLLSERTVVQAAAADGERKAEKWQRVAIEAAKQCGQNWLPTVAKPRAPKDFFNAGEKYDLMLIASLQPGAMPIKKALGEAPSRPTKVLILVGPEGDFTPAEVSLALSNGCRPVTLGPIILRTETAAMYCLSVFSHELLNTV